MASKYEARATEALRALKHRGKITLAEVAQAAKIPQSSMSRIYAGRQPVTLHMLDAIEQITGESAIELLVDPNVELKAVNPPEAALLRYFRTWPKATRDAFIAFLSFFADEAPVTYEQRVAHEQLRRLPEGKRRAAYAYLTYQTEGFFPGEDLPPDIRRALEHPREDAPQSTRTPRAKRPKTPPTPKRP